MPWLLLGAFLLTCDDRDELIAMVEKVVEELPEDDST